MFVILLLEFIVFEKEFLKSNLPLPPLGVFPVKISLNINIYNN